MKQTLIKTIKAIFSDTRASIISLIVVALVGGYAGLLYLSKTILDESLLLLNTPTPLWATIALVFVTGVYVYLKISKSHSLLDFPKPKYYKYCPDCDAAINANNPEIYCSCGTKYFDKCPSCGQKIIRGNGRICSFCGQEFPLDRIPV